MADIIRMECKQTLLHIRQRETFQATIVVDSFEGRCPVYRLSNCLFLLHLSVSLSVSPVFIYLLLCVPLYSLPLYRPHVCHSIPSIPVKFLPPSVSKMLFALSFSDFCCLCHFVFLFLHLSLCLSHSPQPIHFSINFFFSSLLSFPSHSPFILVSPPSFLLFVSLSFHLAFSFFFLFFMHGSFHLPFFSILLFCTFSSLF